MELTSDEKRYLEQRRAAQAVATQGQMQITEAEKALLLALRRIVNDRLEVVVRALQVEQRPEGPGAPGPEAV